jgi:hypothetical protein
MATIVGSPVQCLPLTGPYAAGANPDANLSADGTTSFGNAVYLEGNPGGSIIKLRPAAGSDAQAVCLYTAAGGDLLVTQDGSGAVQTALDDGNGNAAFAGHVQVQRAVTLWSGTGAPTFAATVGDVFLRQDGGGVAGQNIYVCTVATGTWVGIA